MIKNAVIVLLVCVIVFVNAVDYGHPKIRHLHLAQQLPLSWPYDYPQSEDIQDHGGFCTLQLGWEFDSCYEIQIWIYRLLRAGDIVCLHTELTYCDCLVAGKNPRKSPIAVFESYEKAAMFVSGFHDINQKSSYRDWFGVKYEDFCP